MADKVPEIEFAKRIDPTKDNLTPEQIKYIRKVEMAQWQKKTNKLRGRNIITGLAVGAIVMGIYGYTFYSVSQENVMDEIDKEAKVAASMRGSKTGDN